MTGVVGFFADDMAPLLDELKALAPALPPNFRVGSGEIGDVLSALVARAEHGDSIFGAAHDGPQAVADFYHQHISDNRPDGADEPQKGQPVQAAIPTPAGPAGGGVTRAELDQFKSDLLGSIKQMLADQHTSSTADESASSATGGAESSPPVADTSGGAPAGSSSAGAPANVGTEQGGEVI